MIPVIFFNDFIYDISVICDFYIDIDCYVWLYLWYCYY